MSEKRFDEVKHSQIPIVDQSLKFLVDYFNADLEGCYPNSPQYQSVLTALSYLDLVCLHINWAENKLVECWKDK